MTYSQPLGPGVPTGSDVTSTAGGDASPYASDTSDVSQTDASSTDYDVSRPYSSDRAEVPVKTDAGLRCLTEIGQRHLSDLRPATV